MKAISPTASATPICVACINGSMERRMELIFIGHIAMFLFILWLLGQIGLSDIKDD
jgi:hypothetical protein